MDQQPQEALTPRTCPECRRQFDVPLGDEPKHLPFCSDRCQWVDLGRWFSGDYHISKDLLADDDEQSD